MHRPAKRLTLLLSLSFLPALDAIAGTTSITAPAPSPARSNVESSAPPPGTVNNLSAPPPAIDAFPPINTSGPLDAPFSQSLPEGSAQSTSPGGGKGANAPAKEGNVQIDVPPPACTEGSIESFFRCTTPAMPAGNATHPRDTTSREHASNGNRSPVGGFGKLLFHVLDNAGVPLPVGKGADLDPSLTHHDAIAIPKSSTNNSQSFNDKAAAQASQAIPQKIPQSELEGTQFDSIHDSTTP